MKSNITISSLDRTVNIELPEGYTYAVTDTPTGTAVEMADGSIVYEQYGTRRGVVLTCGYLPEGDYIRLVQLVQRFPFVWASYTDIDGAPVGAEFRIELDARELFSISATGARWRGPRITLTAREVTA